MASKILSLVGRSQASLASSVKTQMSFLSKFQFSAKEPCDRNCDIYEAVEHTGEKLVNILGVVHTTLQFLVRAPVVDSDLRRRDIR
jgi:hypothetical protein